MNKSDLCRMVAIREHRTTAEVQQIISAFLEMIELNLCAGEEVSLTNFGRFHRTVRKARTHPVPVGGALTAKPVDIPERVSAAFTPSRNLKIRMNR